MPEAILDSKWFWGETLDIFVEQLKTLGGVANKPGLLLFWGPPGTTDSEVEKVVAAIPIHLHAIGASASELIGDASIRKGVWGAMQISSEYIGSYISFAPINYRQKSEDYVAKAWGAISCNGWTK